MKGRLPHRRAVLQMLAAFGALPVDALSREQAADRDSPAGPGSPRAASQAHHVQPGGSIQDALEAATKDPGNKRVIVHAGTYRPKARAQALIGSTPGTTGSPSRPRAT